MWHRLVLARCQFPIRPGDRLSRPKLVPQSLEDAKRDACGSLRTHKMAGKNCELVASEAGNQVAVSNRSGQPLSNNNQQLVPNTMPIDIVYLLKAVEVQKEDGMAGSSARWRRNQPGIGTHENVFVLGPTGVG